MASEFEMCPKICRFDFTKITKDVQVYFTYPAIVSSLTLKCLISTCHIVSSNIFYALSIFLTNILKNLKVFCIRRLLYSSFVDETVYLENTLDHEILVLI